ncbi:MAG: Mrp/NBP35 family ATP-binding protein [Halobacteria archaeon]|nr:Mrp/NBP35 family ATP-binding protein [Halobacteria archaeon]
MTPSRDDVLEALRNVNDPELGEDIVSLEMVENVRLDGSTAHFRVNLPAPDMKEELRDDITDALSDVEGLEGLQVEWSSEAEAADEESEVLPNVDKVIAVSSGKGGVGKSTVAVNLAAALSDAGATVGLFDSDVYGPNVPRMLGSDAQPRVDKDEKIIPPEKSGIKVMSMGYLTGQDTPVVWRGAMVHNALTQLLNDVNWGDLDYLVVDMPPGTGDAQLTIAQTIPVTGAVIVTTPQTVSLDDSRKGVEMFEKTNVPVVGIVENMSEFVCPDCGGHHDIFGSGAGQKLADEADVPLVGRIPIDPNVRTGGDEGEPIVLSDLDSPAKDALRGAADSIRDEVDSIGDRKLPMV